MLPKCGMRRQIQGATLCCLRCLVGFRLSWVIETEQIGGFVVGKDLRVSCPLRHCLKCSAGVAFGHEVFELVVKTPGLGFVTWAIVEDAPDVCGQGHITEKLLRKDLLAFIDIGQCIASARRKKFDVPTYQFGEAEQLQNLCYRK